MEKQALLRGIPKVDDLMKSDRLQNTDIPSASVKEAVRSELEDLRRKIMSGEITELPKADEICLSAYCRAENDARSSLRRVINATGVVLHTNLGRSCLSERAVRSVCEVAEGYSTLEYDVDEGCRGSRHSHVEQLLCRITDAEAAMVVNNNAAAVLLILSAIGKGGEVITSRGELVEIGGSFRIPEIMMQCGCTLREVGATNKTHIRDYENAVCPETRALLKVHTSNFKIVGFSESVSLTDMVALGKKHDLPVIQDLGSGSLVDLAQFGIRDEPTVQDSVAAGVDIISFSGDKLLGGPQAGIIIGKKEYIEMLKKHPLARAIRIDKMTLAALRETLYSYIDIAAAVRDIPTLSMLAASDDQLHSKAAMLHDALADVGVDSEIIQTEDQVGGGSVPTQLLKSWAVAVDPKAFSVDALEAALRIRDIPIIGRINREQYILDVRTIFVKDIDYIAKTVGEVLA